MNSPKRACYDARIVNGEEISESAIDAPEDARMSRNGRPSVTVSYAQTLDGRLATAGGSSQWISAGDSLRATHELRAAHDAILVGAGTACRDNPRLNVRLVEGVDPLRVVADSGLRLPLDAAVLSEESAPGTLVAVTRRAAEERRRAVRDLGATVVEVAEDREGRLDLSSLLAELGRRGISSVMVEGGSEIITCMLVERLVDRLVVCIAPKILGSGIEAVGELGVRDLDYSLELADVSVTQCGVDLLLDGRLVYPEPSNG
jgi:5-amino-6-(5-phosphoribosylamino)uracil reductase/diaminohydroxyphosphoribosylaminopyrimidine deaminase/5-amino-6-(5-phosphoribosylamino)uracil reductase